MSLPMPLSTATAAPVSPGSHSIERLPPLVYDFVCNILGLKSTTHFLATDTTEIAKKYMATCRLVQGLTAAVAIAGPTAVVASTQLPQPDSLEQAVGIVYEWKEQVIGIMQEKYAQKMQHQPLIRRHHHHDEAELLASTSKNMCVGDDDNHCGFKTSSTQQEQEHEQQQQQIPMTKRSKLSSTKDDEYDDGEKRQQHDHTSVTNVGIDTMEQQQCSVVDQRLLQLPATAAAPPLTRAISIHLHNPWFEKSVLDVDTNAKPNIETSTFKGTDFGIRAPLATPSLIHLPTGREFDSTAKNSNDPNIWKNNESCKPSENDIINGRGGLTNKHPGNLMYRSLVRRCRTFYKASQKHTKLLISRSIVRTIHNLDPPGRFVAADEKSDKKDITWREISDRRAIDKTSQALRELYNHCLEDDIMLHRMNAVFNGMLPRSECPDDNGRDKFENAVEMAVRAAALADLTDLFPDPTNIKKSQNSALASATKRLGLKGESTTTTKPRPSPKEKKDNGSATFPEPFNPLDTLAMVAYSFTTETAEGEVQLQHREPDDSSASALKAEKCDDGATTTITSCCKKRRHLSLSTTNSRRVSPDTCNKTGIGGGTDN